MAEILQKDGSWEPLTPAKETPTRPEYEKAQTDWVPAEESRLRSGSGIDDNQSSPLHCKNLKRKRKNTNVDIADNPDQTPKLKRKKYWPKILDDRKPKKLPKTQKRTRKNSKKTNALTPEPSTPKPARNNKAISPERRRNLKKNVARPLNFDLDTERRKIVSKKQRYQRWKCKQMSIKREPLLSDFPESCKKNRLRHQKPRVFLQFLESNCFAGKIQATVKQFCAAIMDPISFRCVLAMKPIVTSRKKRNNRPKAKVAEGGVGKPLPDHEEESNIPAMSKLQSHGESESPILKSGIKSSGEVSSNTEIQLENGKDATEAQEISNCPNEAAVVNNSQISSVEEIQLIETKEVIEELQNYDATIIFPEEKLSKKSTRGSKSMDCSLVKKPKGAKNIPTWKPATLSMDKFNLSQDGGLFDYIIQKLECLSIADSCKELTPYKGKKKKKSKDDLNVESQVITTSKGRRPKNPLAGKVELDRRTIIAWDRLMGNDDGTGVSEETNEEEKKYWNEQRDSFKGLVNTFIERMHLIQGNRRFSPWKGSVLDSVVGVFLTQNVSDLLSSSSFLTLAAEYPVRSEHNNTDDECEVTAESSKDSEIGSNTEIGSGWRSQESTLSHDIEVEESSRETMGNYIPEIGGLSQESTASKEQNVDYKSAPEEEEEENIPAAHVTEKVASLGRKKEASSEQKKKNEKKINWEEWRKFYSKPRERNPDFKDFVDWEGVRCGSFQDLSNTIQGRGQNNLLAARIKKLLDELHKNVGRLDLEWLRDVPPEKAKEFLLSIDGLGLKSVECVRLLALHHHAFPVDTNVGRVAVRLGWVPLEPLPDNVQIHDLKQYPSMDKIQIYLCPRLCTLDPEKLYELHYQLITFGKVFCTKASPNCNACPMRGDCSYFASAFASKLKLPAPKEKLARRKAKSSRPNQDSSKHMTPLGVPLIAGNSLGSSGHEESCEPIIEFPASPVRGGETVEIQERDIEDLCNDPEDDEIPVIRLDTAEFRSKLLNILEKKAKSMSQSQELVSLTPEELLAITPEAASIPIPNVKKFMKRRKIHLAFELPDDHFLLQEFKFPKRVKGDPGRYLFVPTVESMHHAMADKQSDHTVYGTIMMPVQTTLEEMFPLNGTYFQVNEVFADDESSTRRIGVPSNVLSTLRQRLLFCGTSTTVICKGLSQKQIQHIFCKGFICNRGLNKRTRRVTTLSSDLCPPSAAALKAKDKNSKTKFS